MCNEATIDGKRYSAWTLDDGNIMAGIVLDDCALMTAERIERVDGTICYVPRERLRPATAGDVLEACAFFGRIGK